MSNFCGTCGAPLNPGAANCTNCGAPVIQQQPAKKSFDFSAILKKLPLDDKDQLLKIGKIALPALAGLIVLIIIISAIAGGSGAKGAVKDYFKAIQKQDVDKYIDLMPEVHKYYYDDEEELYDNTEQILNDMIDALESEYGKNIKFKVKDIEKDELTNKEKKAIAAVYDNIEELEDIEIKKAYEVDFEVTVKGKDSKDTDSTTITVIKEDGDWKIYSSFDIY